MKYLKRITLLLLSFLILIAVFVFDVIRATVQIENTHLLVLRELILWVAIGCYILFLRQQELSEKTTPRRLVLLITMAIVTFAVLGVAYGISETSTLPEGKLSLKNLYSMFIAAFSLIAFVILSLHVIRQFVFFKKKKWTRRNFYIYLSLLIAYSYINSPFLGDTITGIETFGALPIIVFIVVLSFRQTWIVFLSKKEKVYNVISTLILFGLFVGIGTFISVQVNFQRNLSYFSTPLYTFIRYNLSFGAVYFGISFISTLFHFPTAELFERKQIELRSLHNLSQLVTNVFDFQQLSASILKVACDVCNAQSSWLELYESSDNKETMKATIAAVEKISEDKASALSQSTDFSRRESAKPFIIEDLWSDRRTRHLRKNGFGRMSLMVLPLVSHGTLIGALYVTKNVEEGFYQDDIDVLSAVADHASIAIENSKLIEQSLERERLKQEFLVAQTMQQRLFPQNVPQYPELDIAAISIPSYEVGGDYYDIIPLTENAVGIIIGDVAGKGVSAAFYMAEVKGIFLALSSLNLSPKEFLVRANTALSESLDKRTFVSLEYAVIDRKFHTVTVARAGHCPALHVTRDGINVIQPTGIGVGLTNTELFKRSTDEWSTTLKYGDILIFFTDGIVEARNDKGEEFGMERLLSIIRNNPTLTAKQLKDVILQNVNQFIGKCTYRDDITMVVVQYKGNTAGNVVEEKENWV